MNYQVNLGGLVFCSIWVCWLSMTTIPDSALYWLNDHFHLNGESKNMDSSLWCLPDQNQKKNSCWGSGDGSIGEKPDVFIFWAQTGQISIKMAMKMKRKWQNLIIDRWFSGCFPMISRANPYPLDPIRLFFDAPYGPWPVHTVHSWNFLNPNHLQGRSTTWIVLIPSPVHISYTPILWSQWNVVIPCNSRNIHHGFVLGGIKILGSWDYTHPIEKKNDPIVRSHENIPWRSQHC